MSSNREHCAQNAVIIGGGVAGTVCSSELSTLMRSHVINVILIDPQSAVKAASVISKVTRSAIDVGIDERDAEHWCKMHGITFIRDLVVEIGAQKVLCESGLTIPFSVCCIASGARPYVPLALRSSDLVDRVVTLRDTDSVSSLQTKLVHSRKIIIVGGGGIAMELVHEVADCKVLWVMKGTHVGSAFFDKRGADCLASMHLLDNYQNTTNPVGRCDNGDAEEVGKVRQEPAVQANVAHGSGVGPEWISRRFEPVLLDKTGKECSGKGNKYVDLHGTAAQKSVGIALNSEITRLEKCKGQWPVIATLSDGCQVGCDLVLVGAGVVPNTEWLKESAVDVDWKGLENPTAPSQYDAPGGILVSAEDFRTSVPSIFAAGDCITVRPGTSGSNWFQMRLWTQALSSGRACAQGMAQMLLGEDVECIGLDFDLFAHATKFFAKKVVFLGRYNAQRLEGGFKMLESGGTARDGYYVRAVIQGGRVRGALLIGEVDAAETFENLILNGLDVSRFGVELVDPTVDMDDYFD